jgi:hypothetical protein
VSTSQILGPDGKPFERPGTEPCPNCGESDKAEIITAFGGHWKRICRCGQVFDRGIGIPPVE